MQSLLTDSFGNNRQQKTIVKAQQKPIDDDQQQEDSKRQEDEVQSQQPSLKSQKKKQESLEELQPMKDAFESDDSYLAVTEEIREERAHNEAMINGGSKNSPIKGGISDANAKAKKIVKKKKDFHWKIMWVKQQNAVKNSKPIWVKKWLRVKSPIDHTDLEPATDKMEEIPNELQLTPVKI